MRSITWFYKSLKIKVCYLISASVPRCQRRPAVSWLVSTIVWPAGPVTIFQYLAPVRPHLELWIQFWASNYKKGIEVLGQVQRTVELLRGAQVWSISLMRSSWGGWGCSAWRKGGSRGVTLSFSTATQKEAVVRWGFVSSLRKEVTGQKMALSFSRGDLGYILGKISFPRVWSEVGTGCSGKCLRHHN